MNKPISQHKLNTNSEIAGSTFVGTATMHSAMQALKKVPEITIYFWIIKLLTTAMGETTSDALVHRLDPIIAVALGGMGLLIALVLQFSVRRYKAPIYWLTVVMVAIFGTMAADVLHIGFGIPYYISTAFFMVALAIIFAIWYATEKTLSIHSIYTRRRELFYWATVIATFALGTALGDMTATTLGLGYLASGVLFTILFALPALAFWLFGLNAILAFWFAYIMTRPLGASFADWMGKTLQLGTAKVSVALAILIVALVGYLTITHKDITSEQKRLLQK